MTQAERALVYCELREFYHGRDAERWLEMPHPQLEGRRPTDCSFAEVMAIVDRLKSGAYI